MDSGRRSAASPSRARARRTARRSLRCGLPGRTIRVGSAGARAASDPRVGYRRPSLATRAERRCSEWIAPRHALRHLGLWPRRRPRTLGSHQSAISEMTTPSSLQKRLDRPRAGRPRLDWAPRAVCNLELSRAAMVTPGQVTTSRSRRLERGCLPTASARARSEHVLGAPSSMDRVCSWLPCSSSSSVWPLKGVRARRRRRRPARALQRAAT